ncbi:MAG: arginine N-succinyltransferase, partial [Actinomycetota bacterium]
MTTTTCASGAHPPILRPVRSSDADALWNLLAPAADELIGLSSLPHDAAGAATACADSGATLADLAAGSFLVEEGGARRLLFLVEQPAEGGPEVLGVTGVTFKHRYPNLAVEVATSADGLGLVMASSSVPWTRTELDSTFLGASARGRGLGTVVSRGRFPFLHLVGSQIPATVASHLRGRFDPDGSAPFWRCFGADLAPWPTSTEAETALAHDPALLDTLAGHRRPLTAEVLESLGPVNAASLPAFHLLGLEGLTPNGMYDPIDGGPTLVADLADTVSGRHRIHGRATIGDPGPTDALVSVAGIDRFRVTRAAITVEPGQLQIDRATALALRIDDDALLTAVPVGAGSGPAGQIAAATGP